MWYVIQTRSGQEQNIRKMMREIRGSAAYEECFIPLCEEVRRSRGKITITFRHLFPGYLFVKTDDPDKLSDAFYKIPGFARILGVEEEDNSKTFIPVEETDMEFLNTLFEDGIMHVSYIKMRSNHYIESVVGPLAKYRNHIVKLDIPHRRAIAETQMFGKMRRIKFGLWLDGDPYLPYLEHNMSLPQEAPLDDGTVIDIGIAPGDMVVDESGLYGEHIFVVENVDAKHRTLSTSFDFGGQVARLRLIADNVRVVGRRPI